jgi:hypothetical protein
MKKFMVLCRAPKSAMEQIARATPEQAKAGMDAWMAWNKKAGKAIVDLGQPLGSGKSVKGNGRAGPSDSDVTGFSIMQAESAAKLEEQLKGHPHFKTPGGTMEVLEFLPMLGP